MTDEQKPDEQKRLPQPIELMHPHSVVLDVVLTWSDTIGEQGRCKVIYTPEADTWSLIMGLRNHVNDKFMLGVIVHFDGEPKDGSDPRHMLRKLGPTVWKLSPSILAPKIHAYVTLIDVPEPAPWEVAQEKLVLWHYSDTIDSPKDNGCEVSESATEEDVALEAWNHCGRIDPLYLTAPNGTRYVARFSTRDLSDV